MKKSEISLLVMILFCCIAPVLFVACTENERAKSFGGTINIEIAPTEKLVNVTWKDNEMWILTRTRKTGEVPEEYKFYEESAWGMWEGTVFIKEK